MEKLFNILTDVRPDIDFNKEKKLIDSGVLDSFDIISIVAEINDAFDISINSADLKNENFNSASAMWDLINEHLAS